jgi:transcription antitermination factor NusG
LMYKEVNVATFLVAEDIKPRLEELMLFRQRKRNGGEDGNDSDDPDQEDEDAAGENGGSSVPHAHFLKELADQIDNLGEEEAKEGVNTILPGDLVQVTSGDLRNLIARVVSVNDATRIAQIVPYNNALTTEMAMEVDLLVKYIFPGAHVKVVGGRYAGQTGRVVSVKSEDGSNVAHLLTDGINSEIKCNVGHLQVRNHFLCFVFILSLSLSLFFLLCLYFAFDLFFFAPAPCF